MNDENKFNKNLGEKQTPSENKNEASKKEINLNFIEHIINDDLKKEKIKGNEIITRFPPEPNGYLHIGHAKSICLNFGLAKKYEGRCHLRFDDTNPETEDMEYEEAIKEDVKWLGFDWGNHLYYASDYFDQLYNWALELIKKGKAYVDSSSAEQIRQNRGTLTEPGKESPYRNRSVNENLELFEKMRSGQFNEGDCVLRAKIDMTAPNINLRDPLLYRIKKQKHHRTCDKWCIYPLYDYAHGQSDAIEHITHSICTLEFEDHRPLYNWFLENLSVPSQPQQIEFARLNLNYTVVAKRKLRELVEKKIVNSWDDPRMPTLQGLRRRGVPPEAIRNFAERVGVTKKDTVSELGYLEACIRETLEQSAPRVMGVLHPIRVVLINYPKDQTEWVESSLHPKDPSFGNRKFPITRDIYIEQDDFMENPPKDFFRLSLGKEVRLRHAYIIKCVNVVKDESGKIKELHCEIDPSTLGKNPADGRKVKGIVHWVSAKYGIPAQVRLYDRLFQTSNPAAEDNFLDHLNPHSYELIERAYVEPFLQGTPPERNFQFERLGYFCTDRFDSQSHTQKGPLVFNRIVSLKDTWAKIAGK